MKRGNFLKSLATILLSPRVVVEALKEPEDEYNRDYGPIMRLESTHGFLYRDGEKIKWRQANEIEMAQFKMYQMVNKTKPYGTCINMDAVRNLQV